MLQLILGTFVIDRDAGNVSRNFGKSGFGSGRSLRLAVVHRKRPQHFSVPGKDRRRPARPQARQFRELAIVFPKWIGEHVRHDYGLATIHRSAAGTILWSNRSAVDSLYVNLGQAWRRAVTNVFSVLAELQHRANHSFRLRLNQRYQTGENIGKCCSLRDHFEHAPLASAESIFRLARFRELVFCFFAATDVSPKDVKYLSFLKWDRGQ